MTRAGAGVIDQAIWSLGTFAISALTGRYLGVDSFGQFSVAIVAVFAVGSIVNSLVIDPALVIGPRDFSNSLKQYGSAVMVETASIGLVAAVAGSLVIWLSGSELGLSVGTGLIVALPTMISWAARRLPYMDERPALAAIGSGVYLLASVGGLVVVNSLGVMSVVTALLVLAGAALLQTTTMLLIWRPSWGSLGSVMNRGVWGRQWKFGRWLLGSEISSWVVNYGLVGFSAGTISLNAAGGFRASQVMLRPFSVAFQGVSAAEVPHAARVVADGALDALVPMVRKTTRLLVVVCLAGSIVMLFGGDEIMGLLFGPEFKSFGGLAAALTGSTVFAALSIGPGIALYAAGFPKDTFWASLVAGVVAMVSGLALGLWLGVGGLVATVWLASATRAFVMMWMWRRRLRTPPGVAPVTDPLGALPGEHGSGRDD